MAFLLLLYIQYIYTIHQIIIKEKSTFHLIFYPASSKIKTPFIL